VEFVLAPNPGVPAAPLREAASGGELSRVMLALMTVAGAGESRTLVFDEVDAGVGGQTARAVGERLRVLGQLHQVLCITHLPQVAAQAESHFRIEKTVDGEPALTTVESLEGDDVEISGTVVPARAHVHVLGNEVDASGGRFTASVPLEPGANIIDVAASADGRSPVVTAVRVVREMPVPVPDLSTGRVALPAFL
jgi:hypothetical protein